MNVTTGYPADNATISVSEADAIRQAHNTDEVLLLLPVIIYVIITIAIGLVGNYLVCHIYYLRLRRSPSRYFILFLAALDLASCLVGAGSELLDLLQPFIYKATWSCKILRFGLSVTIISACFTLICVAFDRYYKICRPLKGFPVRKVKILCSVVIILSLVLSIPALAIYGLKTVETGYPGVQGTECSTADGMKDTPWPMIYYTILFLVFLALFTAFTLLYVRIGVQIYKRKKATIGETLPALVKNKNNTERRFVKQFLPSEVSDPTCLSDDDSRETTSDLPTRIRPSSSVCNTKLNSTMTSNSNAGHSPTKRRKFLKITFSRQKSEMGKMSIRTVRTTSIFFAVSVAFVISFLPYLIAKILQVGKVAFYDIQSPGEEIAYNFFVRSYFISNCINPIIYSALNRNFRRECNKLFKRTIRRIRSTCRHDEPDGINYMYR